MGDKTKRKQVIRGLLEQLVEDKRALRVEETDMSRAVIVTIQTASCDYGRVLGKHQKNINALSVLMRLMAAEDQKEGRLELALPPDGNRAEPHQFKTQPGWDEVFKTVLKSVCAQIFRTGGVVDCQKTGSNVLACDVKINGEEVLEIYEHGTTRVVSDTELETALNDVMKAVAKSNGWNVMLYVVRQHFPKAVAR